MKTLFARCLVSGILGLATIDPLPAQTGGAPQVALSYACGACFAIDDDGSSILIPLESTEVVLDVKPGLLEAEVVQTFVNHGETALEAVYRYPLPPEATLTHFELRFRDRVIVSVVREKGVARADYEVARSEGRKAALLEKQDPTLFSTSVANFLPGETVQTVIRFIQPLELRPDSLEVRFPMVTGTKYFPADAIPGSDGNSTATPERSASGMWGPGHVVSFDIEVAGLSARAVESDSHRVKLEARESDRFLVALEDEVTIPDRDFVLRIQRDVGSNLDPAWVMQRTDTGDYGLLTVFPPKSARASGMVEPRARDVLFLVDQSGSMSGERLASAKKGVDLCLQRMRPQDRFQIVPFGTSHAFYAETWIAADAAAVARARAWVRALEVNGGTNLQPALAASLDAFETGDRDQVLIVLTDGDVGNERSLLTLIERKLRQARVFSLGIGDAPNPYLITRMAEVGRGQARFIAKDRHVARELADLYVTLDAPVLTGARLTFVDAQGLPVPHQSFPEILPDVFVGRPIQTVVRIDEGVPDRLVLAGNEGGRPFVHTIPLKAGWMRGDGLEKLFGARWVADLEDMLRRAPSLDERELIREEILETALQFQLVTEQTSRIAIDREAVQPSAIPHVTVQVPQGQVADQGTTVDPNDPSVIVLSPFTVSTENDTGYYAANTLGGTRLRTDLRDGATCVTIVTREFIEDTGATALEDVLPYMMNLEQQPAVARSGSDTGLLDGLPVATVIDPATVTRIVTSSFGPAWSDISQRRAASRPGKHVGVAISDDGMTRASVEISTALDSEGTLPALVMASWSHFESDRWSAYFDTKKQFDRSEILGTLQLLELEGYGSVAMARASWRYRIDDDLHLETSMLVHRLSREDAAQFRLGSAAARYDGLGFYNLDLLTAETTRIDDVGTQIQLGGKGEAWGARHTWSVRALWHRLDSDWVAAVGDVVDASRSDSLGIDLGDQIDLVDGVVVITPGAGATTYRSPGRSDSRQSAHNASLGVSIEISEGLRVFGTWASDEFLPQAPTGKYVVVGDDLVSRTAALERRAGGQLGLRLDAWDRRVSGQLGWYRETVRNHAYRDWSWERDHTDAGAVWIDSSTVWQPVGTETWPRFVREGWMGSIDVNPTRSLTATASWCFESRSQGPYRGGNRRASILARYEVREGALRGVRVGMGVSHRNDMTFDDGHVLAGGVRWDLMLGYRVRTNSGGQTHVQVNVIDLTDDGLQPTRFAAERGRRCVFSLSRSF